LTFNASQHYPAELKFFSRPKHGFRAVCHTDLHFVPAADIFRRHWLFSCNFMQIIAFLCILRNRYSNDLIKVGSSGEISNSY